MRQILWCYSLRDAPWQDDAGHAEAASQFGPENRGFSLGHQPEIFGPNRRYLRDLLERAIERGRVEGYRIV